MNEQPWWKEAVIYHIYPRSFQDTDRDGFGDLPGIIERLDYVADLGVSAIWMGPVFESPQVDNGYDISDYRRIDSRFGDLQDMERLIEEADRRGIRVLLDLVFNHSSDRHPWFKASVEDRDGPYGDYYIWRDPAPDGGAPNNWRSFFSVPAWSWSERRQQYYLHLFAPEQPDLNWENPEVRQELADIANFWLDRGAAGFRMDVINVISKQHGLPSSKAGERQGLFIDGPRVLPYLQEFRSRLHRKDEIVLVGETPGISPEAARRYTDPGNRALDMVLIFDHVTLDHGPQGRWDPKPLKPAQLRRVVTDWQGVLTDPAWPSIYLSNHDQPRVVSRYGDDLEYRFESATALATAFYLQRGTPIVYQGDEIGMANYPLEEIAEVQDIESSNAYAWLLEEGLSPQEAFRRIRSSARDHGRTPMQWSAAEHGGFTDPDVQPWFPVNPDHREWNVEAQEGCKGEGEAPTPGVRSVLCYFRDLFSLRRREPALVRGTFEALPVREGSGLFAFRRRYREGGDSIVVVANLSDLPSPWDLPILQGELLLSNLPGGFRRGEIAPWQALVFR
ncbi:MAG: alpha-glucosidase [Alkalispirochaetaceae bacterium]